MSIDESEVTQVNGKYSHLFPRPADADSAQGADQPERDSVEIEDEGREPIEGDVVNRPGPRLDMRTTVRTGVSSWWLRSRVFKTIVRELVFVALGAGVFWRRLMDAHTTSLHRREIRTAETGGDRAAIAEWEERARKHKQEVHARHMARLKMPLHFAQALAIGAPALAGFLFLLGVSLAIYQHNVHLVLKPLLTAFGVVSDITEFLMVAVPLTVVFSPAIAFVAFLALGHARTVAPEWIAPEAEQPESLEVVPDENAILKALRNLGWAPMNKAVKAGWQPRWIQPPARIANGWVAQLQMPQGCPVEKLADPRLKNILAHNLVRLPVEVWPTEPANQPTVMDLFVADQGSLTRPIGPWPWLTEGAGDFWKGVPIAESQRGEVIWGPLMAKNYCVGGIMGSGKSSVIKTLLLGALLDPLVEAEVYVMAQNVDYDPMRPVLKRLVKGDDDEDMAEALKALRHIVSDVSYRGRILEELGGEETKLTRDIAERDPRMRPKVIIFDECHELFEHKEFGEEAGELAIKALKKARKVGIVLVFVTVSPTAKSIPKDLSRNASNRVAFALGDHVANDGILGSGKFRAGIRATNLNPATDIGTALTIGFSKNAFELVRTYNVDKRKGLDEVGPIVERIQKLREELAAGGITVSGVAAPAEPEVRDLLADVLAVLQDEPAPAASVATLLKRLAPDWPDYRGLVGVGDKDGPSSLVFQLGRLGAVVPSTANKYMITPELIRAAINRRQADSDEDPEDSDAG